MNEHDYDPNDFEGPVLGLAVAAFALLLMLRSHDDAQ